MDRTWEFTDLEFVALWGRPAEDQLPEPLMFTSRTRIHDVFLRERREVERRLRETPDPAVDDMFEVIARPDIRIVVQGCDGRDPERAAGGIRLLAVRRGEHGYLVRQLPGETLSHSGGFTVTACDALDLAEQVVAALPEVDAGSRADVTLIEKATPQDEIDHSYGRSVITGADEEDSRDRSDEFLDTPAVTLGVIEVVQGRSRFGPRGIIRHAIEWLDLADDGRYVVLPDRPPVATAADARRLAELVNADIAKVVRAIKDERA